MTKQRESTFGEHLKDYGKDIGQTYIRNPIQQKDPIGAITGTAMTGLSLVLEGPDQLYDGVLGRKYKQPAGIAGRIRRDAGALLKNIVTLHPLRAAGDAWKLATSDAILDIGDAIGSHTRSNNYGIAA